MKNSNSCFSRSSSRGEATRKNFSGGTRRTRKSVFFSNVDIADILSILFFIPPPRQYSAARTRSLKKRFLFSHYDLRGHLTKWMQGWKMRKYASISTNPSTLALASDAIMCFENSTRESHWLRRGENPKTLRENLRWWSSNVTYK